MSEVIDLKDNKIAPEEIKKKTVKLGAVMQFVDTIPVETMVLGKKMMVKPGDTFFIGQMNGLPTYNFLTGELAGKVMLLSTEEMGYLKIDGYHSRSIAELLLQRLNFRCGLTNEIYEYNDLDRNSFLDEMEELLDTILDVGDDESK